MLTVTVRSSRPVITHRDGECKVTDLVLRNDGSEVPPGPAPIRQDGKWTLTFAFIDNSS